MGYASRDLVNEADGAPKFSFDVKLAALTAMTAGEKEFAADGVDYTLDADGNILAGGEELGYVSRLVVSAADSSVVVTRDFKNRLEEPSTTTPPSSITPTPRATRPSMTLSTTPPPRSGASSR